MQTSSMGVAPDRVFLFFIFLKSTSLLTLSSQDSKRSMMPTEIIPSNYESKYISQSKSKLLKRKNKFKLSFIGTA